MHFRMLAIIGVAAIALATGVAGCGGSGGSSSSASSSSSTVPLNGEQNKTADQILTDARAAVAAATSVRFVGRNEWLGLPVVGDIYAASDQTAKGTVELGTVDRPETAEFIRVGSDLYLKGGSDYFNRQGVPLRAARLLAGHWVKMPTGTTVPASNPKNPHDPTNLKQISADLLKPEGAVTKAGQGTVRGTHVIYLTDTRKSKIAISLEGKPYPLADIPPAGETLVMTWDTPMTVTAPPGALDLSKVVG